MRGEHRRPGSDHGLAGGSSPHARGAPHAMIANRRFVRIIPACAGSTHLRRGSHRQSWDHPRMRGEHITVVMSGMRVSGSSPHARGAQSADKLVVENQGIIPACAGSTPTPQPRYAISPDHPRMRGEHRPFHSMVGEVVGSSPHARGALCPSSPTMTTRGIIPACAGSTDRASW